MTTAFTASAASAAVKVAAVLFFRAAGNRRGRRHQAVGRLYVAASPTRAHRNLAACD